METIDKKVRELLKKENRSKEVKEQTSTDFAVTEFDFRRLEGEFQAAKAKYEEAKKRLDTTIAECRQVQEEVKDAKIDYFTKQSILIDYEHGHLYR